MKKQKTILAVLVLLVSGMMVLFSCSKSSVSNTTPPVTTSVDSALTNIGTTVIVPAYQGLATATGTLDAAITTFTTTPNTANLASAQAALKLAYVAWEKCSEYQFGPALDQSLLTSAINVFPTDSTLIQSNISSGSYTIDGIANLKAQGFPAIDFLLFGANSSTTIARFTTDVNAAKAKTYLSAISASIKTKAATTATAWSASGSNYLAKFIAAMGVSSGGSLSLLVNSFVQDYDVTLKNYKIGIPFGKYGATALPASPTKVEAYYSGMSVQLMLEQVKAIQNIYLGGTGYGLDDKVIAAKATKNGLALNDVINAEFLAVITKLTAVPDPLSGAITSNNAAVSDAYTEVAKLVVLLKVDLSSALGVKISFQDDDGD